MAQVAPTDTTGYKVTRILAVIEATAGTIPTSPKCIEFKSEDFNIDESQNSEMIKLLGDWDAGKQAFGTTTVSGTSGIVLSIENAPFIMQTALGNRLATANATADVWVLSTAYTVGDIVNSADGKHTLVCTTAGTSNATAEGSFVPNLAANPKDDLGGKIVDATVVWMAMPLYKKDTFAISEFIKTFTIEVEYKTPTGELFYQRLVNCFMGGLPMSMSGGTISAKASMSFTGTKLSESTDSDWDESLSAKAGAVVCPQDKDFYDYESFKLKVDGVSDCAESAELSLSRAATIKDLLDGCKDINLATPEISGNINRVFSTKAKADVAAHTQFKADFEFIKSNKCEMIISYHQVVPSNGKITATTEEKAYLASDINANGTSSQVSITATVTYPAFIDGATGAIVDAIG